MNGPKDNLAYEWTDEQSMDKLGHWDTCRTFEEWTLEELKNTDGQEDIEVGQMKAKHCDRIRLKNVTSYKEDL